MATIYIDPSVKTSGNGSQSRPYKSWSQVKVVKAGDTFLQRAGTSTSATINVAVQGTASAPIRIGSYGTGAAPIINGLINLNGAAYVTVAGMNVRNSAYAAIMMQGGAHHNTISGNTLAQSQMGVWIGNGAGADNLVERNTVLDNAVIGIGVDKITNAAGHATRILGNTISRSGSHGIELTGNNFVVDGNTVSNSGLTTTGSSGIHVFGGFDGAPNGFGVGNTITNNVSYDNRDATGPDGNGIQLDQYTNANTVSGNFATGNDGAGIMLYDSHDNTVANNVTDRNGLGLVGTHPIRGDFVLAGGLDLTRANFITGNIALSTSVPAVLVDGLIVDNANRFSGNIWQNTTGGADTMLGLDTSWSTWLAYDLLGGTGLVPDRETGVPVLLAPYSGTLSYSFASGITQVIDGTNYILVGWTGSQLVVGMEAVA